MKYTITINQLGLKEDKDITLVDASVLGWIHDFCGTNNYKINLNKVDGWTLIRSQYLVDDMPLLRIKTRSGGTKLLHRLERLGYIELKIEPRKLWVKTTPKMDKLWFETVNSGKQEETTVNSGTQTVSHSIQSCIPQDTYHNTNTNTNTNIAPKVQTPFNFKDEIEKLYDSGKRELNVLALFFEKKKLNFTTKEQMNVAIKRHIRSANELKVFGDSKIVWAVGVAEKDYPEIWSISTLVKILTK